MVKRTLLFCLLALGLACQKQPTPTVSSSPSATPFANQTKAGNRLYKQHCAHCHELESGEGPKLKPKVLATHGSAARLFRYNKKFMPYGLDTRLTDQEYWAITAYLLSKSELATIEGDLGPENAENYKLTIPD